MRLMVWSVLALLWGLGSLAWAGPQLIWDSTATPPGTWHIERSLDGAPWVRIAEVPVTTGQGTWEDATVPPGPQAMIMQYRVLAQNAVGTSAPSNEVALTQGGAPRLPQAALVSTSADSEETAKEDGRARNAIDGQAATRWHTAWSTAPAPPLPHWLVVDLGQVMRIDGLEYVPRLDGSPNGTIAEYEIRVSLDGTTWSRPVASGTWRWGAPPLSAQYARWDPTPALYVLLKATKELNGNPWTSAVEVGLYGQPPEPPSTGEPGQVVCTGEIVDEDTMDLRCTRVTR